VDPGAATESASRRSAFEDFCKSEIEEKGGVESEAFQAMIRAELDQEDKEADTLKSTMDDLGMFYCLLPLTDADISHRQYLLNCPRMSSGPGMSRQQDEEF
jgi:hypothetical protein